jgi:hypothetical protein
VDTFLCWMDLSARFCEDGNDPFVCVKSAIFWRTELLRVRVRVRVRIRVTSRLAVYCQSVRLSDEPLETHDQHLFFQLNICGDSPYLTSSLTRRWACRLLLLLELASTVILGSESCGTLPTFYSLRFETPPTCRARSPYLYSPGTGWPSHNPRHWVPFSSPPTTRRATVEVFESASTRDELSLCKQHRGLTFVLMPRKRSPLRCASFPVVHTSSGGAGECSCENEGVTELLL